MILADENLDLIIIDALHANNIGVYSIFELDRGLKDKEIVELSKNPPRIILTEDKDFGEWVFAHDERDISVILLRYDYANIHTIASIVVNLIKEKGEELFGKFTTITVNKVWIRKIK